MKHRLTAQADADIAAILRKTRNLFGRAQVMTYAKIIDDGVAMIAENPSRPACAQRDELGKGVKSFHLELAAKRRRGAAHILYFMETRGAEVVVLRVLHEAMEPKRRLIQALRGQEDEPKAERGP